MKPKVHRPPSVAPNGVAGRAFRHLSIYAALWKNSVAREMGFKGNFLPTYSHRGCG